MATGTSACATPPIPIIIFFRALSRLDLVTAADIIEYDLDSNPIGDTRQSYRERFIHGEIYKARPDVMAIVHDHSPAVIPFSVSSVPLRAVSHHGGVHRRWAFRCSRSATWTG